MKKIVSNKTRKTVKEGKMFLFNFFSFWNSKIITIFKAIKQQKLNILICIKSIFIWPYDHANISKYN